MQNVLDQLIALTELSTQFACVDRAIYKTGTENMENDAEHSFQLAFLGWQLNDMLKLGLDNSLIMKYALAHDIIEVYAGDTDAMGTVGDPATKEKREHDALQRLHAEYSSFGSFVQALEQYEKREDEESRFVYALDKLISSVNVYLNKGRDWKRKHKSLADVRAYKDKKIAVHPEVEKIYNEFIGRLDAHYDDYFND